MEFVVEEHEVERIATSAAKKACHEMMALLGVDYDSVADMREFRSDLVWARKSRRFSEAAKTRAMLVLIGITTAAVVAIFWDGIKSIFNR